MWRLCVTGSLDDSEELQLHEYLLLSRLLHSNPSLTYGTLLSDARKNSP